ncbi:hypothetical protein DFJ73DRAFT_792189 [Zopfochytrium polystomum]|nr:hypothetical protein DFJ73DRAFT_792189 [Zopfochytrium polystomum]
MRLQMRIPKAMPKDWVLKQIAFPPAKEAFTPALSLDGQRLLKPDISYRNQARIRKACILAGLDPKEVVGLPDPIPKRQLAWERMRNIEMRAAVRLPVAKTEEGLDDGDLMTGDDADAFKKRMEKLDTKKLPKGDDREVKAFQRYVP